MHRRALHGPALDTNRREYPPVASRCQAHRGPCSLNAEEQLIIRLRFQDGFTVARIAQLLRDEQKPLYRRIEQILLRLREALIAAGVTREDVRDLLGSPAVELDMVFPEAPAGNLKVGPSTSSSGGQA